MRTARPIASQPAPLTATPLARQATVPEPSCAARGDDVQVHGTHDPIHYDVHHRVACKRHHVGMSCGHALHRVRATAARDRS